ncbi:MAG: hypothetical protein U1F30_12330 [Steroidobacteraceae bacterium]
MAASRRRRQTPSPAPPVADAPPAAPPGPIAPKLLAAEEARLAEALAGADEAALAQFALQGTTTKIRQRAAEAIADPERIRDLIRATRGSKDNAVYRILTTKRDLRLQAERVAAQLQADLEALAAAISRHARLPYDPLYEATVVEHERRWQSWSRRPPRNCAQPSRDLAAARQVLDARREELAAAERQRREAEEAAARERVLAEQAAAARRRERGRGSRRGGAEPSGSLPNARRRSSSAPRHARPATSSACCARHRRSDRGAPVRRGCGRTWRRRSRPCRPRPCPPGSRASFERVDEQLAKLRTGTPSPPVRSAPNSSSACARWSARRLRPSSWPSTSAGSSKWRTLHRGAGEDDGAEAARFRELGHQAYEPCRQHFAAQAAQRAENPARGDPRPARRRGRRRAGRGLAAGRADAGAGAARVAPWHARRWTRRSRRRCRRAQGCAGRTRRAARCRGTRAMSRPSAH